MDDPWSQSAVKGRADGCLIFLRLVIGEIPSLSPAFEPISMLYRQRSGLMMRGHPDWPIRSEHQWAARKTEVRTANVTHRTQNAYLVLQLLLI